MYILGFESSCDETSVAILRNGKEVLANIVVSQIDIHARFGGVVPEIACRQHIANINYVINEAFSVAGIAYEDIDLVAVTQGPGLVGALLVGITAAKTFAMTYNKPIIAVNHLAGHIYANMLEDELHFPCLVLLVSGGNTELILMREHFSFEVIGETADDAVGEAYDKVARILQLGYPGGPIIDSLAKEGVEEYVLPRPMMNSNDYNFSFSGLKSAVLNLCNKLVKEEKEINKKNLAYSFQQAVVDVLISKTIRAAKEFEVNQILVAGGVSANSMLRKAITKECNKLGIKISIPQVKYCTDNAAMIAACGYYYYSMKKEGNTLDFDAIPDLLLN